MKLLLVTMFVAHGVLAGGFAIYFTCVGKDVATAYGFYSGVALAFMLATALDRE